MWLVIVSMFLYGRYLSGMLWGCLIGNKFHTWRLCLGNIQTNSIWTGFVFVRILAFKPFRNLDEFCFLVFNWNWSKLFYTALQCFSLRATFNYFPNNILNKNIFKTKALQHQANLWFIFSFLTAVAVTKSFVSSNLTLKRMSSYNSSSTATAYLRYWLLTEQSLVVVKLFERFWAFDAPDNLLKLFQPVLSSAPGRAVTSPLGAARFPVSLTLLAANDATTSQLCRRLHQRKQNFEIYKFLKQQILVKTEEVKVLREKEKELKTFKRNVRKCSYQTKLVLLP